MFRYQLLGRQCYCRGTVVRLSRKLSTREVTDQNAPHDILVPGLSSLIGPEAVIYFDRERHEVGGVNKIRGGWLAGENHSGTQAHNQIHGADVISAFVEFSKIRAQARGIILAAGAQRRPHLSRQRMATNSLRLIRCFMKISTGRNIRRSDDRNGRTPGKDGLVSGSSS